MECIASQRTLERSEQLIRMPKELIERSNTIILESRKLTITPKEAAAKAHAAAQSRTQNESSSATTEKMLS